jgi:hypothetical protein
MSDVFFFSWIGNLGKGSISKIIKEHSDNPVATGKSARATGITRALASGMPTHVLQQTTHHKNVDSLLSYQQPSLEVTGAASLLAQSLRASAVVIVPDDGEDTNGGGGGGSGTIPEEKKEAVKRKPITDADDDDDFVDLEHFSSAYAKGLSTFMTTRKRARTSKK